MRTWPSLHRLCISVTEKKEEGGKKKKALKTLVHFGAPFIRLENKGIKRHDAQSWGNGGGSRSLLRPKLFCRFH